MKTLLLTIITGLTISLSVGLAHAQPADPPASDTPAVADAVTPDAAPVAAGDSVAPSSSEPVAAPAEPQPTEPAPVPTEPSELASAMFALFAAGKYVMALGGLLLLLGSVLRRLVAVVAKDWANSKLGGKVIGGGTAFLTSFGTGLYSGLGFSASLVVGAIIAGVTAGWFSLAPDAAKKLARA